MTKTMPSALAAGVAVTGLVALLFADSTSPVWRQGEWIRLLITAAALIIGGYVIWKNRTDEALQDSIQALRSAIDAHKAESDALRNRLLSVERDKNAYELECNSLKAKTDVGEVLRMIAVLSSSINDQMKINDAILREILQKVHGWKTDRRSAIRKSDLREDI